MFVRRGCLPQLQNLTLLQVWLPQLCLTAPALKCLAVAISQDMLSDLPLLQHHPTLGAIAMNMRGLQDPRQLPYFLPEGCLVHHLATSSKSADLSNCLPSPEWLPRILAIEGYTREHEHNTDLAPLSACSRLHALTIHVKSTKLTLCGMHSLPPSLRLIRLRWDDPAHPPAHLFHQPAPGWGCRLAGPNMQGMLDLYRLPGTS